MPTQTRMATENCCHETPTLDAQEHVVPVE
jgi:hypothetical protein